MLFRQARYVLLILAMISWHSAIIANEGTLSISDATVLETDSSVLLQVLRIGSSAAGQRPHGDR